MKVMHFQKLNHPMNVIYEGRVKFEKLFGPADEKTYVGSHHGWFDYHTGKLAKGKLHRMLTERQAYHEIREAMAEVKREFTEVT